MKQKNGSTNGIITPKGSALYPWLDKPDTKFDVKGVYQVTQRIQKHEAMDLIKRIDDEILLKKAEAEKINEAIKAKGKEAKAIKEFKPYSFVRDENGVETNEVDFLFKMKASFTGEDGTTEKMCPDVFDSDNELLDPVPRIFSGSIIRVGARVDPYIKNVEVIKVGVSLRLRAVQIIKLVQNSGKKQGSSYGFEPEENGYKANQVIQDKPTLYEAEEDF
jgi:hypothetical protein